MKFKVNERAERVINLGMSPADLITRDGGVRAVTREAIWPEGLSSIALGVDVIVPEGKKLLVRGHADMTAKGLMFPMQALSEGEHTLSSGMFNISGSTQMIMPGDCVLQLRLINDEPFVCELVGEPEVNADPGMNLVDPALKKQEEADVPDLLDPTVADLLKGALNENDKD